MQGVSRGVSRQARGRSRVAARRPWLVMALLALFAGQLAHVAANWLAPENGDASQELFQHPWTGEQAVMPLTAVLVAAMLVALARRATGRAGSSATMPAWPFAVLQIVVFVVQEFIEYSAAFGSMTAAPFTEPSFAFGIGLQLLSAGLAYVAARRLLGLADAVATLGSTPSAKDESPRGPQAADAGTTVELAVQNGSFADAAARTTGRLRTLLTP